MKPVTSIVIKDGDNVIISIDGHAPGTTILEDVTCVENIPPKHKCARRAIAKGKPIIKNGDVIGHASCNINAGQHVHRHNIDFTRFEKLDYSFKGRNPPEHRSVDDSRTWMGFTRPSGQAGTENNLLVLANNHCAGPVAQIIARIFNEQHLSRFANVTRAIGINHSGGCGLHGGGSDDHLQLGRVLAGYCTNPNFFPGGVVTSLGCEICQPDSWTSIHRASGVTPEVLTMQTIGGSEKTIQSGVKQLCRLAEKANNVTRSSQSLSKLVIGNECGGSDGMSGWTINTVVGMMSDMLIDRGGSAMLAETPENTGCHDALAARAVSDEVARKLLSFFSFWNEVYFPAFGAWLNPCPSVWSNPAEGNYEGGLSNDLEKSQGANKKGGTRRMVQALDYGERIDMSRPGFCFMNTPGYDPASMAGLVAGHCNLATFTTGQGNMSGYPGIPTIKCSSNTAVFNRLPDDIDFDGGRIVSQGASAQQLASELLNLVIEVASGRHETHSTRLNRLYGAWNDIVVWPIGPMV